MKKAGILIALLTAIMLSFTGAGCKAKYTKHETSDFKINASSKTKLVIENISGPIKVTRSDTEEITINAVTEVKVRKRDRDKPLDEIIIKIDSTTEIVTLTAETNENKDRSIFSDGLDARIDYTISIPANMELKIESVSGDVTVNGIAGDVDIELVSGDVDLMNVSGRVHADIANGDISMEIDSTAGVSLNAINGDVRLNLSETMNTRIKADVVNGRITHEQLSFASLFEEKGSFRGTLGAPGAEIIIDIVNGKIRLYGKKSNVI